MHMRGPTIYQWPGLYGHLSHLLIALTLAERKRLGARPGSRHYFFIDGWIRGTRFRIAEMATATDDELAAIADRFGL